MKRLLFHFVLSALGAYTLFALVGLAATPSLGDPLSDDETAAALSLAFPEEGSDWSQMSGYAAHGHLYRRAYVEGTSLAGARRSEQVLKVGWPFTVVRGFVRSGGSETVDFGVGWHSEATDGEPARLLPVQPVWPGLAFYGLLSVLASGARIIRPGARAQALSA